MQAQSKPDKENLDPLIDCWQMTMTEIETDDDGAEPLLLGGNYSILLTNRKIAEPNASLVDLDLEYYIRTQQLKSL
jgi:hypothetical protein